MLGPRTGRENIRTLVRPRRALAKQGGVLGTSMGAALPPWVPAPPLWAVRWARLFAARGLLNFALRLPFGVLSGQLAPLGGSYSREESNPSNPLQQ